MFKLNGDKIIRTIRYYDALKKRPPDSIIMEIMEYIDEAENEIWGKEEENKDDRQYSFWKPRLVFSK